MCTYWYTCVYYTYTHSLHVCIVMQCCTNNIVCVLQVSYWVASEICCVEDSRLRGILLEKFIEVAKVIYTRIGV